MDVDEIMLFIFGGVAKLRGEPRDAKSELLIAAAGPVLSIVLGLGLLALRELHQRYGHIQEVIVQNFRAKPAIPMSHHPDPTRDDMLKTIALARVDVAAQVRTDSADTAEVFFMRRGRSDFGAPSLTK